MFSDRTEAGKILAKALATYGLDSPLVLAVPRGGVVIGREVAFALNADLDVILAKKIGAPFNPEFAVAATDQDGEVVLPAPNYGEIPQSHILAQAAAVRRDIEHSLARLRKQRPALPIAGRTVVLVDDGLATGLTVAAALQYVRRREPSHLYVAVPVAPRETLDAIKPLVDDVICPLCPPVFYSVGEWYLSFDQVSDDEVKRILDSFRRKVE